MRVNELRAIWAPSRLVAPGATFRYQGGALAGRQIHDPELLRLSFTELIGEPLAVGGERRGAPLKTAGVEQSLGRAS